MTARRSPSQVPAQMQSPVDGLQDKVTSPRRDPASARHGHPGTRRGGEAGRPEILPDQGSVWREWRPNPSTQERPDVICRGFSQGSYPMTLAMLKILSADAFFTDELTRKTCTRRRRPHRRASNGRGYVLRLGGRVCHDHGVVQAWFVKLFRRGRPTSTCWRSSPSSSPSSHL